MKSIVVGNGLLGTTIQNILKTETKDQFLVFGKNIVDLLSLDISYLEKLIEYHSPEVVFFCAANTNVEDCEQNDLSYLSNVAGTIAALNAFIRQGAIIVFPSSSYVFDGKSSVPYPENANKNPINTYGLQKVVVEQFLVQNIKQSIIVRTVGVFGELDPKKKNFAHQIIDKHRSFSSIPSDQMMNPIHAEDLSRAMIRLAKDKRTGEIVNVAGDTVLSKYHFASLILELAHNRGVSFPFVYPMETRNINQKASRPIMGALETSKMKMFGLEIPSLKNGIEKFLDGVLLNEQ